ncbi:DUF4127 family protein [Peptococcaceae bacterium 1198_IL3148]
MLKKLLLMLTLIFCFTLTACAEDNKEITLLYIPMDERPVNLDYVADTINATSFNLLLPPEEYLPHIKQPGQVDKLWQWLFDNCSQADYLVLSADALVYGGLTPSRIHNLDQATLTDRVDKFNQLKQQNPDAKLYVFSTLMRTHKGNTNVAEPDYYGTYGSRIFQLTALRDKAEIEGLAAAEEVKLNQLLTDIPGDVLTDWYQRREKNLAINRQLLEQTKTNVMDYMILCRDDTLSYSQSHKEYRSLTEEIAALDAAKYNSFPGADEVGLVLLTRALNDAQGNTPAVYTSYAPGRGANTTPKYEDVTLGESVTAHIVAAGGKVIAEPEQADLILAVNTPEDGVIGEAGSAANVAEPKRTTTALVNDISRHIGKGRRVAVADVALANGADNSLMATLANQKLLPQLTAYAGWNTAGNTVGYALAQGMLSQDIGEADRLHLLAVRLLDDWGYQANVRSQVQQGNINKYNLGPDKGPVATEIEQQLKTFATDNLKDFPIDQLKVDLPWNRTFDILLEVEP